MLFNEGIYAGTPAKLGIFVDFYFVDEIAYSLVFAVSEYVYEAPDSVAITASGREISYSIKPSAFYRENKMSRTAPKKWELQFFNALTGTFISKVCVNSLNGKIDLGEYRGVYAKAYSGCTEMDEPDFKNFKISNLKKRKRVIFPKL
jgi:hypothetical protein